MPKSLQQKRDEAEERRLAHDARTPMQQMGLVRKRPGDSLRERDKLIAKIEGGIK